MPFATTGASLRRLPLFFAYCPDRAGVLAKRLAVRPAHWARWKEDLDSGRGEFGLGFKPPQGAPSLLTPNLPPDSPELAGSVMLIRAENLERAWARIKEDLYWTEGVWDQDKCRVEEFTTNPLYHD